MKRLSQTATKIDGQPMFKVLDKVKKLERAGRRVIHFEIGDPDFNTPENIINAAYSAMKNGHTHYTSSYGLMEFRESICKATKNSRGFTPDISQVLVTPGANIAIYYAIVCLVDPGYEIIVPDPGFPTYYSTIKMCNTTPIRVPLREENQFRMNPRDIEEKVTDKTRLIIINSPQNPTGAVMTKDELDEIYKIAKKYDFYIYSDEVYARMIYSGAKFESISRHDLCSERVIISNGFSKSFAMTGWRLGAVIGPTEIIERMELLLQTTSSCVSPFIQMAGKEAIEGDQTAVKAMVSEYEDRRNTLVDGLNSIKGISCVNPEGAFYAFANIKKTGLTSEEFADYILDEANVAVLPGTNFGQCGEGYVRLCYATNKNNIIEGLERIKAALNKL
jgi:aspartate/methionine/tyrosine aminotransferase